MYFYDLPEQEQKRLRDAGVDYSLSGCLEYNTQDFSVTDIEKVVAVWEGENDGDDWRWVLKVTKQCSEKNGGRYVFLQGGCDYTGWDCQSWATSQFAKTALKAARLSLGDVKLGEKSPMDAGMGHILNLLSGGYGNNFKQVFDSLVSQIMSERKKTWREAKDEELGTSSLPKIN